MMVYRFQCACHRDELNFGRVDTAAYKSYGRSAFIDDDRFGAVQAKDRALTKFKGDQGSNLTGEPDSNASSYLVSGRAAPVPGYQHCKSCTFMDWGWWGTRVGIDNDGTITADGVSKRRDYVHLGTWVAGDITNLSDLPTSGTASYAGTALGSVALYQPGSSNTVSEGTYIEKGKFNMTFNFGSRTGTATIQNFGGMTGTGSIGENSSLARSNFSGHLSGASGLTGQITGNFTNGNGQFAEGVLGQFAFDDPINSRSAVGTFLGER